MTAAVGFPTLRLVRYSIGNISIQNMNSGAIKELKEAELKNLFS
jgi:23S rRNA pseudouridine2457 synthase